MNQTPVFYRCEILIACSHFLLYGHSLSQEERLALKLPMDSLTNRNKVPLIRNWRYRVLAKLAAVTCVVVFGFWSYFWWLGSEAREIYQLGSSLNDFLSGYVSALKRQNVEEVLSHYHTDYHNEAEGLWNEDVLWSDPLSSSEDALTVSAWGQTSPGEFTRSEMLMQIEGLLERLDYVTFAKFKIEGIEANEGLESASLRSLLWLRGEQENGQKIEMHATLRLNVVDDDGWKIQKQELLHGSTVRGTGAGFTDVTQEVGIAFTEKHNPMLREEEWLPKRFEIVKYATGGVAVADYNNDGWYDIFFGDGESSRLYRNDGQGRFEDVTTEVGLSDQEKAVGVALFADLDNDGDADLFLGSPTRDNSLYRNDGDGTFTDVGGAANLPNHWISTAAATDYDNDGRVDLYLGRYLDPRIDVPTTLFYTRNGVGNSLHRNVGDLKFTDVTETAGVRDGGLTLGIAWGDYDRDGDPDVYLANDFGRNTLFRNNGDGTFADVSKESGTIDIGYGMSSSFADIDDDGDLDVYVSNVHSGQRWFGNIATLKNYLVTSFKQGTIAEDKTSLSEIYDIIGADLEQFGDRVIRGNSLFLNNGDGTFTDVSEASGVNPHGWYWSSLVFDYDHDGHQDIYAANGWITGKEADDL